jgi:hypothetical protein
MFLKNLVHWGSNVLTRRFVQWSIHCPHKSLYNESGYLSRSKQLNVSIEVSTLGSIILAKPCAMDLDISLDHRD